MADQRSSRKMNFRMWWFIFMSIAREFPTTCRTDNHSEADTPPRDRQSPEAWRHTHLDLHCYLNVVLAGIALHPVFWCRRRIPVRRAAPRPTNDHGNATVGNRVVRECCRQTLSHRAI